MYKLDRNKALIIQGPEGCGKTLLAYTIAAANGSLSVVTPDNMIDMFGLGECLIDDPNTLIFDEAIMDDEFFAFIKLILGEEILVNRKGHDPRVMKTPNIIICPNQDYGIESNDTSERRFKVITLS